MLRQRFAGALALSLLATLVLVGSPARATSLDDAMAITAPADMTVTADQVCGQSNCAQVIYSFTAINGTPPYRFICTPLDSGSLFLVGTHVVSCMAQDSRGNSSPFASFTLTVLPGGPTPPPPPPPPPMLAITAPADMTVTADQVCGLSNCTNVYYAFTITGGTPPYRTICTPVDSGSLFLVGTWTVSCMAQDYRNNSTPFASFTLTVLPGGPTPPTTLPPPPPMLAITAPPPQTVTANQVCGQDYCAYAYYTFTITGGTPPYRTVCTPLDSGSLFRVGTWTVSCMAQDYRNNSTPFAAFALTVRPPEAPGGGTGSGGSGGGTGSGSSGGGGTGSDTGTNGGGVANTSATSAGATTAGQTTTAGTVHLGGTPLVGHVLTARVTNGSPEHYSWQLNRGGTWRQLGRQTTAQLRVKASYAGYRLRVRVVLADGRAIYSSTTTPVRR